TRFSSPASLLWTEFRGNGDFQYSHFENRADFRNTIFNGSVNFWGSRFDKSVLFSEALFAREAYFNEVHLLQEANFGLARFERTALFEYAQFGGYSDFRWVQFLGDAGFKKAHFMGPVDFRDSRFRSDADFRGCRFDVDFDIRGIEFSKMLVEWNAIRDQLVCEGRVYLDLIRNFKSQERFEDANGCYYQYRQQRMEQRSWEDINKYLDILGWLTCGFGVRPDYTIISIVSMIVVFGGLYWRMDIFRDISPSIQSIDHKGDRTRLIDALFFSTVLFFTMPPPIICISQRSRYLILVEDILGWLLMTLFIVTLVNVMIS
ncbi:MAG: hypothetical protein GKC10_06060, partial [Methanosarcinales archaeon]|nr:hypothetical protein [Methanosarcinales archaeon]